MKQQFLRISLDVFIMVLFGVLAYIIFNSETLFEGNPISFLVLIPLKMSMSIFHWFLFRKVMQHWVGKVEWNVPIKDMNANTLFALTSFVMFVVAYTSYS